VLPLIRAHRPKLPHPVYETTDYRMPNGKPVIADRPAASVYG
jgi:hypothetical protein